MILLDYEAIYYKLISRAGNVEIEGYKERHHIVPRCLGGTDRADNLVWLSGREHFIAHQLLMKMHPRHRGLAWAAHLMTGRSKLIGGRARNYEWVKRKSAQLISESQKGISRPTTAVQRAAYDARIGIPLTEEHRANVSKANKGKKRTLEQRARIAESARNRPPMPESQKEKYRKQMLGNSISKGVPKSAEQLVLLAEKMKGNTFRRGKKATEETRQKIIRGLTGRSPTEETRAKLSKANRVFTDDQVASVIADAATGLYTQKQIGLRNGMSQPHVSRIIRNENKSAIR